MTDLDRIDAAIAALQAQRGLLGEPVLAAALAPLLAQRDALRAGAGSQLRQVSVLFVDVAESTRLIDRLDPEDALEIVGTALQRFAERVEQQGGRVLRFTGDGLKAAFGVAEVREDDAERAVLAGLAVLDDARAHAEHVRQRYGRDGFAVRAGIHTGPVVLGGGVEADATMTGHAVHVAARMEQSAPLGALRVSQATWRQVSGSFDGDAQPPLQVKGSDEPLLTWIVRRARPRSERLRSRGIDGLVTPLLGRDAELAQLTECAQRAGGGLCAVSVIADAGLGKTRLLAEFRSAWSAGSEGARVLEGRCHPQLRLQPWGLLRDWLTRWLRISDDDSAAAARQALVVGLLPYLSGLADPEADAQIVGQLIGLDFGDSPHLRGVDAAQMRTRAFRALVLVLARLAGAAAGPPCLLLEDLHWADDASLEFVQHLLGLVDAPPLLLLMTARPALLEREPHWGEGQARHRRLELVPLDDRHSAKLAGSLLGRVDAAPPALHAMLIERAEGNPFYMEEIVKMLLDGGAIESDGARWRVHADRLARLQVPATLVGVLQARLDSLAAADRRALQQASIVGPVFWDDALAALDPQAPQALPLLTSKALVRPRAQGAFEGTQEEVFHHHLLHQVTYDTVLKAARRDGHAKAARWLAERVGDRAAEYLAATAEHFERAGEHAMAIDYFERAIGEAFRRDARGTAAAYLERVLAMPELSDPRRRFKLLVKQGDCADFFGRRDVQQQSLDERERIAEELDDDGLRADVLIDRALLLDRQGDDEQAYEVAQRGRALAEPIAAARAAALCCGEMAWVHYMRGELDAARTHLQAALGWARRLPGDGPPGNKDALYEIQLLTIASGIEQAARDYTAARAAAERGLAMAQAISDRRTQSTLLVQLGDLAFDVGDRAAARQAFASARQVARTIAQLGREADAVQRLADVALADGEHERALQLAEQSIELHRRSALARALSRSLLLRARVLADLPGADPAATEAAFDDAIASYRRMQSDPDVCVAQSLFADWHRRRGNLPAARGLVDDVMARLERRLSLAGTGDGERARLCCQRVLAASGDARAAPLLAALNREMRATASRFADAALRERFLDAAPWRREIHDALPATEG